MCNRKINEVIEVFRGITSNKSDNVSSIHSLEKRVASLFKDVEQDFAAPSLELALTEELLHLVHISQFVPASYKISYWLEFGVPSTIRSMEQKVDVILGGFFNLAV